MSQLVQVSDDFIMTQWHVYQYREAHGQRNDGGMIWVWIRNITTICICKEKHRATIQSEKQMKYKMPSREASSCTTGQNFKGVFTP